MTTVTLILAGLNVLYVGTLAGFTALLWRATARIRHLQRELRLEKTAGLALLERTRRAETFAERVAGQRSTDPPLPPRPRN